MTLKKYDDLEPFYGKGERPKPKGKDIHFRTTEHRYKALAKSAIDIEVTRNVFIEQAIDFYLKHLTKES
jgi:hypothetical protein